MLTSYTKAPFPYFGGKRHAAPLVWALLGDVAHYVEPFCGSMAILLERPHPCNRPYHSETVNDADGLLINAFRAIQWQPDATAEACSWPVSETCKQARQAALLDWARSGILDLLAGSPEWCDPTMAGWWLYGVCTQIGAFHGEGPWTADPVTGRLVKHGTGEPGISRKRPHLSNHGQGVTRPQLREPGVRRNLPHLSDNGQGVTRPQLREPGVSRDLPHLSDNGQGVTRPQLREPGVSRDLPHPESSSGQALSDNGRGVEHGGLREPGVKRGLPHLSDDGRGVTRPQLREPGVKRGLPHLSDDGRGVTHAGLREPGTGEDPEFHPLVMPELRRWFRWLSARLRHVRIVNGDWSRVCTEGARLTLNIRQDKGQFCGLFIDPPYSTTERDAVLYRQESDVIAAVQAWCVQAGTHPQTRLVLAGYDTEHTILEAHGWTVHEWYQGGHIRGGYGNIAGSNGHQQHRERLWASPACTVVAVQQLGLF